jgi:excisionase family DNA binding protein
LVKPAPAARDLSELSQQFALSVREACQLARVGRSQLYEALKAGELRAKKRGATTLILPAELHRWLENLPDFEAGSTRRKPRRKSPAVRLVACT